MWYSRNHSITFEELSVSRGLSVSESQAGHPHRVEDGHLSQRGPHHLDGCLSFSSRHAICLPTVHRKSDQSCRRIHHACAGSCGGCWWPSQIRHHEFAAGTLYRLGRTVRIKKANASSWVTADYSIP